MNNHKLENIFLYLLWIVVISYMWFWCVSFTFPHHSFLPLPKSCIVI